MLFGIGCWSAVLVSEPADHLSRSVLSGKRPELTWFAAERQKCSSHVALLMILSWQLFVRAARHGNVAFAPGVSFKVRAQYDCHTPQGPNIM